MSNSEEIEVEVVEVDESRPATHSKPPKREGTQSPLGGTFGSGGAFRSRLPARSIRIPRYLWPLAIALGLIILLLAAVIAVILIVPFLIIRAIVRLLLGSSR